MHLSLVTNLLPFHDLECLSAESWTASSTSHESRVTGRWVFESSNLQVFKSSNHLVSYVFSSCRLALIMQLLSTCSEFNFNSNFAVQVISHVLHEWPESLPILVPICGRGHTDPFWIQTDHGKCQPLQHPPSPAPHQSHISAACLHFVVSNAFVTPCVVRGHSFNPAWMKRCGWTRAGSSDQAGSCTQPWAAFGAETPSRRISWSFRISTMVQNPALQFFRLGQLDCGYLLLTQSIPPDRPCVAHISPVFSFLSTL